MESVGIRGSILWTSVRWGCRGLLAFVALFAMAWSTALFLGSRRLEAALLQTRSDPQLSCPSAETWLNPGPGENGAPYFSAAIALVAEPDQRQYSDVAGFLRIGWTNLPEPRRAHLRTWLAGKQAAFDLAAQGSDRPWCRFYRNWNDPPWKVQAPEAQGILNLGLALVARARLQAIDGLHQEARESIRVALAVADSLRDDPFRVSQRCRNQVHDEILRGVQEIVRLDLTSEGVCEWLRIVPGPDRFDGCMERMAQWEFQQLSALLSGPLSQYWQGFAYMTGRRDRSSVFLNRLQDPVVMFDGARALEHIAGKIRVSRMTYTEAKAAAMRLDHEFGSRSGQWNPVSQYL